MFRRAILSLLLFAAISIDGRVARQANDTLRQALAAKHLPTEAKKLANFDKGITSWAELDDANRPFLLIATTGSARNGKARAFRTRTQIRLSLTITVTAPS